MFKPHDVRGRYGTEVDEAKFFALGRAAACTFGKTLLSGRDYREHHQQLEAAFVSGFALEGGASASRLGAVPSPVIAHAGAAFSVAFTASHNPAGYCGAKFFSGKLFADEAAILRLKAAYDGLEPVAAPKDFACLPPTGDARRIIGSYLQDLPEFGEGLFDLSGGAACAVRQVFPKTIFDSPDPQFRLHDAEPKQETLGELEALTVKRGLVGYAFDGDADRMVAVDRGAVVEGHAVACFLAQNSLKKNDKVVLSIDCASEAFTWLADHGFKPAYSKVGDVNVIEKALAIGARMGAERSGHYAFPPGHPYPDGLRAAAMVSAVAKPGQLLELSKEFKNVTLIEQVFTRADFAKMAKLARQERGVLQVVDLDGVKADFEEFSILVRQSNTEPKIRVNVESADLKKCRKGMRLAKGWVASCKARAV